MRNGQYGYYSDQSGHELSEHEPEIGDIVRGFEYGTGTPYTMTNASVGEMEVVGFVKNSSLGYQIEVRILSKELTHVKDIDNIPVQAKYFYLIRRRQERALSIDNLFRDVNLNFSF